MFFDDEFEVFLANTDESRELHYQLRYQVYCQEMGFEDESLFESKLETDEFDEMSVHFIARSKLTNEWVGAIRLIVGGFQELPIFSFVDQLFHQRRIEVGISNSGAKLAAEISRLCILERYRKADCSHKLIERRGENRQPIILLGLIRAAYAYCLRYQVDVCLFMIKKSLARIMGSLALNITQLGDGVEYRGLRVPYCAHIPNFIDNLYQRSEGLHEMFVRDNPYCAYGVTSSPIRAIASRV